MQEEGVYFTPARVQGGLPSHHLSQCVGRKGALSP